MSEFDFDALAEATLDAANKGAVKYKPTAVRAAADYLRDRVTAAFVVRDDRDHFAALAEARYHAGRDATARADAAEAEVARLREALENILLSVGDASMDGYVENSLHIDEVTAARQALAATR